MGKFKMRTVAQFLVKKRQYDVKKDPVWVYLENEMRANIGRKPYNEKVGNWLKFLKELKHFYHCEARGKLRRLERDVGPCWYVEFSDYQREVLGYLRKNIHIDITENRPVRVSQSLKDLGITLKFKRNVLMNSMLKSQDEIGLFMWSLYETTYKAPPCVLQKKYTRDAMIMMSSFVFIDLENCIKALDRMTAAKEPPPPVKTIRLKSATKKQPCPYLQQADQVQMYSNHPSGPRELPPKPLPLGCKVQLRTKSSYTKLCEDVSFLEKRIQKYKRKENPEERVCNYKFWDPPVRGEGISKALAKKMKMIKKKAKKKFKSAYKNLQFHVGGVAFTGEVPNYILPSVTLVPTGYTIINGGVKPVGREYVTIIQGHWIHPKKIIKACDATCDCVEKWGEAVMGYMKESSCKCGHLNDYTSNVNVCDEPLKFFHPPSRHGPYWVDLPKIFRLDPVTDFITDCVDDAVKDRDERNVYQMPTEASDMSDRTILEALLADLSHSTLMIPHLPEACYLNNLLEWVRKRLHGKITPKQHKKLMLVSERKWLDLKHIDFRARAFYIPFTPKQLDHFTWKHRALVQELFQILLDDFVLRNRLNQLRQSRLYWPTTFYDAYPSKPFLNTFYTYLPGRMQDTFLINPYCPENAGSRTSKACPLDKTVSLL